MALLLDKSIKELFVEAPPLLILPVFYFDKLFTKKKTHVFYNVLITHIILQWNYFTNDTVSM